VVNFYIAEKLPLSILHKGTLLYSVLQKFKESCFFIRYWKSFEGWFHLHSA